MKVLTTTTKQNNIINPYQQKLANKNQRYQKSPEIAHFRNTEKLLSLKHIYQENDHGYFFNNKSLNKSEMTKIYTKKLDKQKQTIFELKKNNRNSTNMKSIILKQNRQFQVKQQNAGQLNKLEAFFRYFPISIVSICNQRQQIMNQYSEGSVKVFNCNTMKTIYNQNYQKLKRAAKLKGKYRYREKHNPNYSLQLKALNYKIMKKETKIKKKQTEQSSEDQDGKSQNKKEEKLRSELNFKKSLELSSDPKIFIIKGNYKDMKAALEERGWIQNPDKFSKFFDFKWTTKISDIQYQSLQPYQIVNHFHNTQSLTSKYGLCKSLRTIIFNENVDVDKFYPRCFDLADLSDFQNFIQNYKWTFCESLLKQFVEIPNKYQHQIYKIKIAIQVTERRLANLLQILHQIKKQSFNICSIQQWAILNDTQTRQERIQYVLRKFQDETQNLLERTKKVLLKLKEKDPQYDLSGFRNMWILKPNYLSRGRGIKCMVKFNQILDYTLGKDNHFVVQKYIQNPLLIMNRKFDIRQWVLVQGYSPPKIWFYEECYLRFCTQQYQIQNINNKFMHLTNNSIQKYSKDFHKSQIQGNMWSMKQFSNYLDSTQQKSDTWTEIQKKIKDIIIWSIKSTQDQVDSRKNSYELFGYDFMIDDDLKPWLIQINTSPAMDYSSLVTKKLVKMVMQDIVKVIIDSKNKKKGKYLNTGNFKCIYKGQQHRKNKYPI